MSDSEPSISEENAVLRAELQQQGQPITHAQAFLEAWKQAPNLTITEFNQLVSDPTGQTEQKKKDAEYTAVAVAQREADAHYAQSFKTLKSITLEDYSRDWEGTFEKYIEASKKAWEKYDQGCSTENDRQILAHSIGCAHASLDTPAKLKEWQEKDPRGRAFIEGMKHKLEMDGVFYPGMSEKEKREKTTEAIKNLKPEDRDRILEGSKRIVSDNELERYSATNHEYKQIINDKNSVEMKAAISEPNEDIRKQKINDISEKAYAQMKSPDDAKFLAEKKKAFYEDKELSDLYKSATQDVKKYIVQSDRTAAEMTGKNRGQVKWDMENTTYDKPKGQISEETFNKILPQILTEAQKLHPEMTAEKLTKMFHDDPGGFSKLVEKGIDAHDKKEIDARAKAQGLFDFTSIGSFFSNTPTPTTQTLGIAAISAASPMAGLVAQGAGLITSPEVKAALGNLSPEALNKVEAIKEACGCSDKKAPENPPPVQNTPTPPAQQETQPAKNPVEVQVLAQNTTPSAHIG